MKQLYKVYVKNFKTNEIADVKYLNNQEEVKTYTEYLNFVYRFHKNKIYSIMIDEYAFQSKEIHPIITINN